MATRKTRSRKGGHARVGRRRKSEIASTAKRKLKRGYSPTTAAGEFVHEEIHHVRERKHGAKNPKQAIAIGLSKARRAGLPVPPRKGR